MRLNGLGSVIESQEKRKRCQMEEKKRKRGRPARKWSRKAKPEISEENLNPSPGENVDAVKPENKDVVFWSRAIKCRIANFTEEERDGAGRITRPEGSIRFYDNLYITSKPNEIKFIRESSAFEAGDVRECHGGIKEAQTMTNQRNAAKYSNMDEKAEYNVSEEIVEG
jgi:hypothetical protein